jgi:hypothetical protein
VPITTRVTARCRCQRSLNSGPARLGSSPGSHALGRPRRRAELRVGEEPRHVRRPPTSVQSLWACRSRLRMIETQSRTVRSDRPALRMCSSHASSDGNAPGAVSSRTSRSVAVAAGRPAVRRPRRWQQRSAGASRVIVPGGVDADGRHGRATPTRSRGIRMAPHTRQPCTRTGAGLNRAANSVDASHCQRQSSLIQR